MEEEEEKVMQSLFELDLIEDDSYDLDDPFQGSRQQILDDILGCTSTQDDQNNLKRKSCEQEGIDHGTRLKDFFLSQDDAFGLEKRCVSQQLILSSSTMQKESDSKSDRSSIKKASDGKGNEGF